MSGCWLSRQGRSRGLWKCQWWIGDWSLGHAMFMHSLTLIYALLKPSGLGGSRWGDGAVVHCSPAAGYGRSIRDGSEDYRSASDE